MNNRQIVRTTKPHPAHQNRATTAAASGRHSGFHWLSGQRRVLVSVLVVLAVLSGVLSAPDLSRAQTGPLNAPGGLCVRIDRQQLILSDTVEWPDAQLLILDHSDSMEEYALTGQQRFTLAKDVLREVVSDTPGDANLGLRIYGFDGSCIETELLVPIGPLNSGLILNTINRIGEPDGMTPIADALSYIPSDFRGISGSKEVLLITDGQETCGGDPVRVARSLANADPELTIHVVGFEISDAEAQQNLREIPRVARGMYIPAETNRDLLQALSVSIRVPFFVYDRSGRFLNEGLANRSTIALDPGTYLVDVPDFGIRDETVPVSQGRGSSLQIDERGRVFVVENDPLCIAEFCPDVPLPRLVVGQGGRVTYGDPRPVRVRSAPGLDGQILDMLELGEEFDVLDGPICADGYLWWRISNRRLQGWSAEGVFGNYYLEPW